MTLKVIHRLQTFSNAIRRTFVQHFTRYQLAVCSHGSSALAEILVNSSVKKRPYYFNWRSVSRGSFAVAELLVSQCTGRTDEPTDRSRESLTTIGRCATRATRPNNILSYFLLSYFFLLHFQLLTIFWWSWTLHGMWWPKINNRQHYPVLTTNRG